MRQGQNKNRMRGRGNNNNSRKGGNSRNQSYESNGPDVKVRGNAQQVVEKYLTLARDASSAGDRINAESYYQFAEHYYRIMNANAANEQQQQQRHQQNADSEAGGEADTGNAGDENSQRTEIDDAPQETSPDGEDNGSVEASDKGGDENGRSRRRSSRRGNGRQKDPADQPQPDVADALEAESAPEPAAQAIAEDTEESANV